LPASELTVRTPSVVTFTISSQSITLESIDQASLVVFGTAIDLSRLAVDPIYDPTTQKLFVST
jgi:hypothetical protein